MHDLPQRFISIVSSTFYDGEMWLQELPQIIAACEARWQLTVGPPFAELSYNYVAPATTADGTEIVLKLGVPRNELRTEIESLKIFDGRGICRLLDADVKTGALLLERLRPGGMLTAVADNEEATLIAVAVMKKLWQPVPQKHNFPSVADWFGGLAECRATFNGGTGPIPTRLFETAEALSEELLATDFEPFLMHGDLHHYNILQAAREPWLAIDPKGLVGDPAFEVAAFVRNPLDLHTWPNVKQVINQRLEIFAEQLAIDRQRLIAWCLAFEVLSNWWDYEDLGRSGWQMNTRLAKIYLDLLD